MFHPKSLLMLIGVLYLLPTGCKRAEEKKTPAESEAEKPHVHADGTTHAEHDDHAAHDDAHMGNDDDHDHDEVALGTITIGDVTVELAQAHGKVEAGKESHLVVKLSYDDKGQTVVRAWLGTEDRLLSMVGRGEYAASHGDYDIHAVAPDPLPEDVMWWIEIQKPDGTKAVGSVRPILD